VFELVELTAVWIRPQVAVVVKLRVVVAIFTLYTARHQAAADPGRVGMEELA
jgi:hypothetical protein